MSGELLTFSVLEHTHCIASELSYHCKNISNAVAHKYRCIGFSLGLLVCTIMVALKKKLSRLLGKSDQRFDNSLDSVPSLSFLLYESYIVTHL